MTRVVTFFSTFALLTGVAFAHHGWGSYDANKPLTVTGPIVTSKLRTHTLRSRCGAVTRSGC